MVSIDHRHRLLRAQAREWGTEFRPLAPAVDRDPEAIRDHLGLAGVKFLSTMGVPAAYRTPDRIGPYTFDGTTALERVIVMEELAAADAGVLVASPGPLLAGVLVQVLGDERQQAWFYERMAAQQLWTCFALTEPGRGSDAASMLTSFTPAPDGGVTVEGEKRYIGNAARAQLAVVFGRTAPGPFGIGAVMLDTTAPGFTAHRIPTIGLRGLMLSAIRLDGVAIPPEQVLGRHLSPSRRGMWGFIRTFNLLRPAVAAIALGIARAAWRYVNDNRRDLTASERHDLDRLRCRLDGTRRLVTLAASAVDERPEDGHLASAAKLSGARLAIDATTLACSYFGPGARLEHPLLDKLARDARATEFLEGTSHMQLLNLAHATVAGRLDPVPA
ncbi:acyl-CoA/acyl-ACP dehydrogenase [Dactylosporangium vinaceum]|uniref:Acyl-CoA dehydrogenase family protein n=1 Tax=Dactylosporangium vinaceum TaxID=53362 RepID=A0ABV5ML55_9ACTN|nr:acyl-CoA dehydrogenase family protein [Dactylosporangium vinaceum]UAB94052.1 acyl-CoA/acyl-ACP dehydrogenase [Dactylosporangium vinaceum]